MKLAKAQIAHQFSRAASTYDRVAALQFVMAAKLIEQIPALSTGTLVDFGCGTGWALRQIDARQQFELVGVDIAPGMIEIAKTKVPTAQFLCCDLENTPLETESVDIVFSNAALQWCDTRAAIKEMSRVCKPGGTVYLSTFGPKTLNELRTAWQHADSDSPRVHAFEPTATLASRLEENEFHNVSLKHVEEVRKFDSVDALLQSIKKLGATNASPSRPAGLLGRDRYRNFRGVLEQRLSDDGQLALTFECVYVTAEKPR